MRILLAAAVACGGGPATNNTFVMRVDRALDRTAAVVTERDISPDRYQPVTAIDRWEVAFDGPSVTLVPIAPIHPTQGRIAGTEVSSSADERRFTLGDGAFAGGRFVVRGDRAEVTLYGSGVPIVSSELGTLVRR
jgi:hypothetical protein